MLNWDETKLKDLLLYDAWNPYDAWCVLAGLDFEKMISNKTDSSDALLLIENNVFEDWANAKENIDRFRKWWLSGGKANESDTPESFISWALSKQFEPIWINWAIENGLVRKELLTDWKSQSRGLFDKDGPTYPPELDLAMQAWEAVRNDKGKGKPKAKVKAWLDKNTKLSNEAKERISTVVNWDKTGGATRTD